MNEDRNIRAALDRHWAASDANDFEAEHEIYHDDAVLEYPQSGERIRGRRNIQASRFAQPNKKRFVVRRVLGAAGLWVTEFVLTYDGLPSYTGVSWSSETGRLPVRPSTSAIPSSRGPRALNGSSGYAEMFAMKSRLPTTWLPRIRLPRSRHERHDFAMIAPQYTNSTISVNVGFWHNSEEL